MIMFAPQRGGTRQLTAHLLKDRENDHVTLHELRGFRADDLTGAMMEAYVLAKARIASSLLLAELEPAQGRTGSLNGIVAADDRAEGKLRLKTSLAP